MQNNSKLNTILLIVLIILVCGVIWIQWHSRKAEEGKDRYKEEQTSESGLQKIISQYPGYPIQLCSYKGKTYYKSLHAIGGGTHLYNEEGEHIAGAGIGPQGDPIGGFTEEQENILRTCTTRVYTPQ